MYNERNQYHLTYGENYKDPNSPGWGFTRLQDVFDELNRLGENKVIIELSILDSNTDPIFQKLWKRIERAARTNGFTIKINETNGYGFRSTGIMERKH